MSQVAYRGVETHPEKNYLNADSSISSWLLTVDHKRIGLLYLISIAVFFAIGGTMAALIRAELLTPAGDLLSADAYNKAFTIHGVTLIFFFLVPSIPAVLGNFLVPIMVGAKDVAFPRLNLLSWYVFISGAIFTLASLIFGGVDTGWTFYTPYSSTFSHTAVTLAVAGVFMAGFSSIFTGLNFIVTIHKMRAPGLTWNRLPLFIWSTYATSVIMVLGTPVLAITLFLVGVERVAHIGIFDPALGGDPVLFQHLFWFYSHPAVYIMVLPSMGVMSELIACFSRNRPFGYDFIAYSSLALAALSFVVWGHHMFTSGQSIYTSIVFSILSYLVAVPSAVKVFNWTATMYKGRVILDSPMLYALGFLGLFTIGGLTGLFLATLGVDVHMHDTYFVVAHFHYIMVGGAIMGFMGGIHFWWPKMTGRMYPETFGKLSALTIFIGFNLTFFPQFIMGYMGMPRRYHSYVDDYHVWHVLSSAGASILIGGYIMTIAYLLWSLKYGQKATANPWGAKGLEWNIPSPPPTENFYVTPVVREEAYAYNNEAEEDVHASV